MSFAYGEAHIKPKDDSRPEESLGKTLVVTLYTALIVLGNPRPGRRGDSRLILETNLVSSTCSPGIMR